MSWVDTGLKWDTASGRSAGTRVVCGVSPPSGLTRLARLFDALSELTSIRFQSCESGGWEDLAGFIQIGAPERSMQTALSQGIPTMIVASSEPEGRVESGCALRFSGHRSLPASLRGECWIVSSVPVADGLTLGEGEEALAWADDRVLWAVRTCGNTRAYRVAVPLPLLRKGEPLSLYLNGESFNAVLPLIHFLRERTATHPLQPRPLRACFIFDDPNLRRTSYGCLSVLKLAAHAREHGYHAAVAMAPLDGWWISSRAAALFREQSKHLSLVIHGNNHTWLELGRLRTPDDYLALLAQALRRVQRVERRHGIRFCRVMEPPFGVVHHSAFASLVALGYEAVLSPRASF
jgi:hypothetical protein